MSAGVRDGPLEKLGGGGYFFNVCNLSLGCQMCMQSFYGYVTLHLIFLPNTCDKLFSYTLQDVLATIINN